MGFQGGRAPLAAGGITPVNLKKRKREALGLPSFRFFYADFFKNALINEDFVLRQGRELRAEGIYSTPTFVRSEPDAGRWQKTINQCFLNAHRPHAGRQYAPRKPGCARA